MPKHKRIDIKKILEKNPSVNAKELAKVLEILKELRNAGVQIESYNLEMPFSKGLQRRRPNSADSEEEDPRLVRLGRI